MGGRDPPSLPSHYTDSLGSLSRAPKAAESESELAFEEIHLPRELHTFSSMSSLQGTHVCLMPRQGWEGREGP